MYEKMMIQLSATQRYSLTEAIFGGFLLVLCD